MDIVVTASRDLSCIVRSSGNPIEKIVFSRSLTPVRYGTTTLGFIYEHLYFRRCPRRLLSILQTVPFMPVLKMEQFKVWISTTMLVQRTQTL